MTVLAKFYVAEVTKYPTVGDTRPGYADPAPFGKVILRPVTRGHENADWASSTPAGVIELTVRSEAMKQFDAWLGTELRITFEPFDSLAT